MPHSFSIIIVTWNGLHHLKEFLPSVYYTDYESFEIIIADNASTDETADWIRINYPDCRIVTFDKNYGYCGGNNRAVPYATRDIIVFLNNDVKVTADWLKHLNESFHSQRTAIVQPKMLSYEQPDYFEYAGAAGGMIDRLGYPFCRGRLFDHVEKDHGQYDDESAISWASGAALAIRKEVFNELGGFDEDFEFHMEEIDLCWQAWKKGYEIRFQPKSIVYHLGGGSMPMGSARKVYFNYRNSLLMLTKNLDSSLVPNILLRLCLDGIAGIRSLLRFKPHETLAIISAHFAFYKRLPTALKKRKLLKRKKSESAENDLPLYPKLVIVDVFLKGKKHFNELNFEKNNKDVHNVG